MKQGAEKRREEAQKAYEAKVEVRRKKAKEGKPVTCAEPKAPKSAKELIEESKETMNLTDPESRVMRKNGRSTYTQSLNVQISVDVDGCGLIVGEHTTQSASNLNQLEPAIAAIPESLGLPSRVLADAGYLNGKAITSIQNRGIEVYCSASREDAHDERKYDYRPPKERNKKVRELRDPDLIAMWDKLSTPEGKAIYKQRARTVEPAFGIIKETMGFRGFTLRGLAKMSGEWTLMCHAFNLKRLHTHMST